MSPPGLPIAIPSASAVVEDKRKPVKARAAWDYEASRSDELSFRANDVLTVYPPRPNDPREWLTAELDGKKGCASILAYKSVDNSDTTGMSPLITFGFCGQRAQ